MTAPLIWSALLDLKRVVNRSGSFVLPGFYGATVDGAVRFVPSAVAAILPALIVARCWTLTCMRNWTVSGFLSAGSRIVQAAPWPHYA